MARVAALLTLLTLFVSGCHSAYVEANVQNATSGPVTLLEVDYPSASFGKDELAVGQSFHYRFKILGNGGTKVTWTDAQHHEHSNAGPQLIEGQQGTASIVLKDSTVDWHLNLIPIYLR